LEEVVERKKLIERDPEPFAMDVNRVIRRSKNEGLMGRFTKPFGAVVLLVAFEKSRNKERCIAKRTWKRGLGRHNRDTAKKEKAGRVRVGRTTMGEWIWL
jgi:hypothetical protein